MAIISELFIENYRNLAPQLLKPCDGFNVFIGKNGQGKTNLIEAIYFLAHNKSFKTRRIEKIIHHNATQLLLRATLKNQMVENRINLRRNHQKSEIFINNSIIRNTGSLTQLMPMQLISADRGFIVCAPPKIKRQCLDWGVFHVKQEMLGFFSKHRQLVTQINHLLLTKNNSKTLSVWFDALAETAVIINKSRVDYLNELQQILKENKRRTTLLKDFIMQLDAGFPKGVDVLDVASIRQSFDQQRNYFLRKGFLSYGCHRANINFTAAKIPLDLFSRGEQKILSIIFYLLQIFHLKQNNIDAIVLIDDISSELDSKKTQILLNFIAKLELQVFLTNITPLPTFNVNNSIKVHSINRGSVKEK